MATKVFISRTSVKVSESPATIAQAMNDSNGHIDVTHGGKTIRIYKSHVVAIMEAS